MPAADREPPLSGDLARAEARMPLSAVALRTFIDDLNRLLRLNPHLEIRHWDGVRLAARNELNGCDLDTPVRVERLPHGLALRYAEGLKQSTEITVANDGSDARLVVCERYPRIEDEADPRLVEVDRSLVPWVAAIHRHLQGRQRWGRLPGWRWWSERFLPSMPPRQRRIVRLLVWSSLLELLLFAALVAGLRLGGVF